MTEDSNQKGELFEKVVAKFLRTIIDLELHVEHAKTDLLENHLFNPYVAFQYFDRFNQGYATKTDMHAMFKKYSIEVSDQELDYLFYFKGKVGESASVLLRPDALFYENFLNILTPANAKSLSSNLSAQKDMHAGKSHMLPTYVFDQFIDYVRKQLKSFDALQSLQIELINLYGYTATPAYKLISPDDGTITYFEMKIFLERQGFALSQSDFRLLCSLHETSRLEYMSKSGFLNLFTPFDRNVYLKISDRSNVNLGDGKHKKLLNDYLGNSYRYQAESKIQAEDDPKLKEVARVMQNLYSNHQEVDKYSKRHLFVNPDGRIMYDLTKKHLPYHQVTGFKDYYDQYHKQLYQDAKTETHDLLLNQPIDHIKKEVVASDPKRSGDNDLTRYVQSMDKRPSSSLSMATEIKALKLFSKNQPLQTIS